ncbi:MAG: hypothetical protein SFY66_16740 [Oculatellaceae cyanobacterium bins.114]|nr:hypothetical protein [Oculatellaceae cyanobacterium bins.114]
MSEFDIAIGLGTLATALSGVALYQSLRGSIKMRDIPENLEADVEVRLTERDNKLDVFKFVAVRPTQLISEKTVQRNFIRDQREQNSEGLNYLTQLSRSLVNSEEAKEQFTQLDLKPLEPLVEVYEKARDCFETSTDKKNIPTAKAMLAQTELARPSEDRIKTLQELAWDALYIGFKTGTDAAQRIEIPTVALRALHFASLAAEGMLDSREDALTALTATPVIAKLFYEIADERPDTEGSTEVISLAQTQTTGEAEISMQNLMQEIISTQLLLEEGINTPELFQPEISQSETPLTSDEQQGSRNDAFLSSIPRFQTVLTDSMAENTNQILAKLGINDSTSVPNAIQKLQNHTTALTRQAYALRDNPDFRRIVRGFPRNNPLLAIFSPNDLLDRDFDVVEDVPDVDVSGRIRPLGIGDLKVVKEKLLAYVPGEVAHIENVLKGESKERKHRTLDRTESILFTSEEDNQETERDTQTTDRFELKKEAEKTLKEDMSVQAGVTATGSYGTVTITAHGDFAYSTSKQESIKNSANFARDVVDRSVTKIQKRVKTERTTKTIKEIEESNTHGLDNKDGDDNVVGIYRWVNKKYRAQVYNYGRRMMLEFVVPEPSAYYRASQIKATEQVIDEKPPEPFLKLDRSPITSTDIDINTYETFASRYNASGVEPPPPLSVNVGIAFEQGGLELGKTFAKAVKDLTIPEGYTLDYYSAKISAIWKFHPQLSIQIGNDQYSLENANHPDGFDGRQYVRGQLVGDALSKTSGVLPISIVGYDIVAYVVNVVAICKCTDEKLKKWQMQTFDKIYTAYKALQTAYDQKVAQAKSQAVGVVIEGRNPDINREIEKRELKKLCLTMLTGQHFNSFDAMTAPPDQPKNLPEVNVFEALDEGRYIQFFEQAFEWEQITYLFYPYFWTRKSKWVELSNDYDPDPSFTQFLQAGAARVIVPVSPAYNDSILYFLESQEKDINKKIWQGGEPPRLNDPLFISIAEEFKNKTDDLSGATPEGESWEFTVPTTLVWLQKDDALPSFT